MDLETTEHISELNSAIAFLSLKNAIALFSSEMCSVVSKSTSHPQTMTCRHYKELISRGQSVSQLESNYKLAAKASELYLPIWSARALMITKQGA